MFHTYEGSLKIKEKNTNYEIRVVQTDYQTFNGQKRRAQTEDYPNAVLLWEIESMIEREFKSKNKTPILAGLLYSSYSKLNYKLHSEMSQ